MGHRGKWLALFAAVVGLVALSPGSAVAQTDKDCPDFASQKEAQEYLRANPSDPDGLDGNDNDGIACESNPGPFDRVPVSAQQVSSSTVPVAVTSTTAAVSVVTQPRTATTLRATVRSTTTGMATTGPSSTTLIAGVGVLMVAAGFGARRRAGDTRPTGAYYV